MFSVTVDKFMLTMHLRQTGFTYSACRPFTTSKEKIQKFKETWNLRYIYENELDKVCFQHKMDNGGFISLPRKTASDEVLRDEAFNTAKNPKYDGYQFGLASIVYKFFVYKFAGANNSFGAIKSDSMPK